MMQVSLTVLTDSPWVSLLGMLIAIVVVIGLAYWFTRYIVGKGRIPALSMMSRRDEKLSVLAQTQIGKDQRLAVVQAGERYLLVGVTAHNISLLSELTAEEEALAKRARNRKSASKPKNADPVDYKLATAFEALIGWLSLSGQKDRMEELIFKAMEIAEENNGEG